MTQSLYMIGSGKTVSWGNKTYMLFKGELFYTYRQTSSRTFLLLLYCILQKVWTVHVFKRLKTNSQRTVYIFLYPHDVDHTYKRMVLQESNVSIWPAKPTDFKIRLLTGHQPLPIRYIYIVSVLYKYIYILISCEIAV